jgi:hypothetical protein
MTTAPATSAAVIDGVDVDAVAAAVTACPGVSALFGGRGDAIASYLPGRRVPGVEVSGGTVGITVRSRWDTTAPALLTQISNAVSPILHGNRLRIIVADIDDPNLPLTLQTAADTAPPRPVAPVIAAGPEPHSTRPGTVEPTTPDAVTLRPPGSSPAPSAPAPQPAPPNFPIA